MKILIVFPTKIEAKNFAPNFSTHSLEVLVSGIATYNTIYALCTQCGKRRPDIILHAGIAGTFDNSLSLGDVVCVSEDCFADIGVFEENTFKNLFDLKFEDKNTFPFQKGFLPISNSYTPLHIPSVRGITVHEITSSKERKHLLQQKYKPAIESMEGAAVHYFSIKEKIPCIHLRAISNYVGDRDKKNWHISSAISSLHAEIHKTIEEL